MRDCTLLDWATAYARIAVGAAFLSAVASRFGVWEGKPDLHHFSGFIQYASQVLSFVPASLVPFFAYSATVLETTLGILLIAGVWLRWVALASAGLLALFGISMAVSLGAESPFDYSVFSASGAAFLLSAHAFAQKRENARPE